MNVETKVFGLLELFVLLSHQALTMLSNAYFSYQRQNKTTIHRITIESTSNKYPYTLHITHTHHDMAQMKKWTNHYNFKP